MTKTIQASHVDVVERSLRAEGFSYKAVSNLSSDHAPVTRKVYQSNLCHWRELCRFRLSLSFRTEIWDSSSYLNISKFMHFLLATVQTALEYGTALGSLHVKPYDPLRLPQSNRYLRRLVSYYTYGSRPCKIRADVTFSLRPDLCRKN